MPKIRSEVFTWCCKLQSKSILNLKALSFGIYFSILSALRLSGKEEGKTQEFIIYLCSVASIFFTVWLFKKM